jgi:hypothetical protein
MAETPKTTDSAETADSVPVHRPARLVAIRALIAEPKKRRLLIAGASVVVLLGLMTVAVVAISPMRKLSAEPVRVSSEHLLQEPENKADKKSGVEERFEAMKRGEFSLNQASRKVETVTNASSERTKDAVGPSAADMPEHFRSVPETRSQGKDPALADKMEKEVALGAGSAVASAKARSPAPEPTTSGCDVGAGDPKASAAAILACILEFNAMESREGPRKAQAKKKEAP